MSIGDTALGQTDAGKALLNGLDVYTVPASGDGHPLAVYGIDSQNPSQTAIENHNVRPILLLHGRTWLSVPVYHLLGGTNKKVEEAEVSWRHCAIMVFNPMQWTFVASVVLPLMLRGWLSPFAALPTSETASEMDRRKTRE
jgi:hypothetical protein